MIHPIYIAGKNETTGLMTEPMPIGKYEEEGVVKGISLLDVIEKVKLAPPNTRILEVHIVSPGGLVEEGDNIYNYLESLQKEYVVNTVQDGDIASIATKLFAVGLDRKADPSKKFLIHNPWSDPGPGDANHQLANLEMLLAEEERLRKFYSEKFNITEEGLKPLMDAETTIPGRLLLTLGIATSLKSNVKVMAMKKPGAPAAPSLAKRVATLYASITGKTIKDEGADPQGLNITLADDRTLMIDAAGEDAMVGAAATLDGAAAPDGDYPTKPDAEGMSDIITVAGGKVTAVVEQPVASKQPVTQPAAMQALEAKVDKITKGMGDIVAVLNEVIENQAEAPVTEATVEARIKALKDEIGTTHEPKKGAVVYASSVKKEAEGHETITQVMARKSAERRAQLHKN